MEDVCIGSKDLMAFQLLYLLISFYNKLYNKLLFIKRKAAYFYCIKHSVRFDWSKVHFIGIPPVLHFGANAQISIGDDFICRSGSNYGICGNRSIISVGNNANLTIGKQSGMTNVSIQCTKSIFIGSYVNVGANSLIMDSNFHSLDWKKREDRKTDVQHALSKPINIGDYVFIGANCIIGKGVTIGDKSIVAAGSVVVKSIPSNEIWGGILLNS